MPSEMIGDEFMVSTRCYASSARHAKADKSPVNIKRDAGRRTRTWTREITDGPRYLIGAHQATVGLTRRKGLEFFRRVLGLAEKSLHPRSIGRSRIYAINADPIGQVISRHRASKSEHRTLAGTVEGAAR
jgi:hypothetical protein